MTFRPGQRLVIPGVQVFQPRVSAGANFTGVLDGISNVAAAYSLRKLRSAYAGSAVRVRRSSDSTEQDIGFASDGEFDSSAFSSFVGGGTGYVKTWYDQSGNGRDATQSSNARQPRVVLSGLNSKPSLDFVASSKQYFSIAATIFQRPCTLFQCMVFDIFGTIDSQPVILANNNLLPIFAVDGATSKLEFYNGAYNRASSTISIGTGYIINLVANASSTRIGSNGNLSTIAATIAATGATLTIGARSDLLNNASYMFDGYMTELVLLSVELSPSDINTIGTNMATRYGLSWTTVT